MSKEAPSHQTNTSIVKSIPSEVAAGTEISLKVKVSCSCRCDLHGKMVRILAQDGTMIREVALTHFEEGINETDEFTVEAPIKLQAYTWSAIFPSQEIGGGFHEESSTPVSFVVRSHTTSIAAWDVPSPIAFNAEFKVKVGVKCSATCELTGKKIEIYDHNGGKVATEILGGVPWPQTSGLYWAEVKLEAPRVEGYYTWAAKFTGFELGIPHEGISHTFGFRTAKPAEHTVKINVSDRDKRIPIRNANILLGTYRTSTDELGVAKIEVPKGKYQLFVSGYLGDEYETFQTTVEVTGDVTIEAELLTAHPRLYKRA